jgi:hypothetical protein
MSLEFFLPQCQTASNRKLFGLCDDPPPTNNPAYIDEQHGEKWIAIVINEYLQYVTFTAIDNCVPIIREDGTTDKRCDGMLTYADVLIFVELKERSAIGNQWVKDAEQQLRATISNFKKTNKSKNFSVKKAYIANSEHPKFKETQVGRMERFLSETGYILRIENRITLT